MIALENVTTFYGLLIAVDVALVIFHILHAVARPSDKTRLQYTILACLTLLFNVSNILLPESFTGFPFMIEYTFAYATGILTLFYMGYYAIKTFALPKSRMVTVNSLAIFIFGPLVFAFMVPFYITEDLSLARQLSAVFPIPFETLLVYHATRALINRRKKDATPVKQPIEELNPIPTYVGLVAWALFPVLVLTGDSRDLEITTANAGFHIMAAGYIYYSIKRSRSEYTRLQQQAIAVAGMSDSRRQAILNIAREIKAPIDLVNFYIKEYITKRAIETDDRWSELVTNTLHGVSADIETLLEINQVENALEESPVTDISSIVEKRLQTFRSMAGERGVELSAVVHPALNTKAHPREIRRIADTLLANAINYTDRGGHVEACLFEDEDNIVFVIKDSGKGIPVEVQDRIFEIDYNLTKQRAVNDGLGLSLHLMRRIVQHLQGNIKLTSEPGIGTQVTVYLPKYVTGLASQAEPDLDETPLEKHYSAADRLQDRHDRFILIASGDERMLNVICLHLEKKYNIYTARDGAEALNRLHTLPQVDLVIAEIQLEKIDGFDLLKEISSTEFLKRIPVMFIAPQSSPKSKSKAMELGAVGYFDQLFDVDEMSQQIENLLRNVDQQKKAVLEIAFKLSKYTLPKASSETAFARNARKFKLSDREVEVVQLMKSGDSYKVIADRLNISLKTIETHVSNMFRKVEVFNKVALLAKLDEESADITDILSERQPNPADKRRK